MLVQAFSEIVKREGKFLLEVNLEPTETAATAADSALDDPLINQPLVNERHTLLEMFQVSVLTYDKAYGLIGLAWAG